MPFRGIFVLTAALIGCATATACETKVGASVANQISIDFATLVHFTKASCIASNDAGKCAVLCVSDLDLSDTNRNIALVVITASAGLRMREAGISRFSRILFSDSSLIVAKRALTIDASHASELQQGLSKSSEKPLEMAARIGAEFKQYAAGEK